MTFPGQLPSCVFFAVGDHVSHKRRRRRRRTAEAVWLTGKWQNESRVSHSLDPHLTPPSELEKLVTRPRRQIAVLVFTMNSNVVNPSNQWAIFQQYLSVVLNCCFGLTVIPHVSVLLSMSHLTEITKLQISFGWISLQIRYFFFLAAGIYCKYISLNTSYLLTVSHQCEVCRIHLDTFSHSFFSPTNLVETGDGKLSARFILQQHHFLFPMRENL